MRLVYDNRADAATITASTTSGSLVASNLANNAPELVWRATNKQPTITLTWAAAQPVEAAAIAWTNLTAAATITFRVFTETADVTPAQTTTVTAASAGAPCVYSAFFPSGTTGKKVEVYISDTTNGANVQVGRVIVGPTLRPSRGVRPGGRAVGQRPVQRLEIGVRHPPGGAGPGPTAPSASSSTCSTPSRPTPTCCSCAGAPAASCSPPSSPTPFTPTITPTACWGARPAAMNRPWRSWGCRPGP
jgi:hypothetical protein